MHPKFFQLIFNNHYSKIVFIILPIIMTSCGRNQQTEFTNLSEAFIQWYFKTWPVAATQIGFHSHDSEFGKFDRKSELEVLADLKRFNIELSQIDPAILKDKDRIDYQILSNSINELIFDIDKLQKIQWTPQYLPSIIGDGIYSLVEREFAPMEVRVKSIELRLSQIPRVVREIQNRLVNAPEIYTETAIEQTTGLIESIERLPLEIRTDNATFDRIDKYIKSSIKSLTKYREWLKNGPLNKNKRDFRIGKDLYDEKFSYSVTDVIKPEVLLDQAQSSLITTQNKMFLLALPEYLSKNDEPIWVSRTDTLHVISWVLNRIAKIHPSRDMVVQKATNTIEELSEFIKSHGIVTLDNIDPLIIREMPPYMQGFSVANLDAPGALDKDQAVFYNISPIPEDWSENKAESFLREYNNISISILSIHEALPGHFVQLSYAQNEPSVIRAIFGSSTMVEGWAHYAEGMMIEAGYGGRNPHFELIQKKWALRGIINAIIDQQIHAGSMTKEEAIMLMREQGFQETAEAEGKWRRAQLSYCQLSTYFAGSKEMWDMRESYERKKGQDFNLSDFHESVLSFGSIPIHFIKSELLGN
ncbi:MAG: DUF885 domain-containing protein [Fidelibacterota bacterium]